MVDSEAVGYASVLAKQAVATARLDLLGAAQATAAVVADTACRQHWKLTSKAVQKRANPDIDEIPISQILQVFCLAALGAAFAAFWPDRGDPVPDSYNRHASIHNASEVQYTKANALQAIMTAVLAVCQIDHELARLDASGHEDEAVA